MEFAAAHLTLTCISFCCKQIQSFRRIPSLKALNCLEDDDYDTILMESVSLPCNVSGGIGFVGVATPSEVVITLPERPCGSSFP